MSGADEIGLLRARRRDRLAGLHEERRTLDERAFYPAHDVRVESSAYTRVRHRMIVVEDLPCRVCGVRQSTLRDRRANGYAAAAMETHHHVIEWAHAGAIDVGKFNAIVVAELRGRDPARYRRAFSEAEMRAGLIMTATTSGCCVTCTIGIGGLGCMPSAGRSGGCRGCCGTRWSGRFDGLLGWAVRGVSR